MSSGPARQESLRERNMELVFDQVLAVDGPISRTELAARTGLTRPTITRIVDELMAASLIAESGSASTGRAGRPRVGLSPSSKGPAGLGLDIRTDGLASCVVDLTGTVRHMSFSPFDFTDTDESAVLHRLGRMADQAREAVAAESLNVVAATLAVPGPTDGGIVRSAPSLGWRDVDAGALLGEALEDPAIEVAVDNEANLAACGELHTAVDAPVDFVYVSGGLDLGAGIMMGGELLRGARGWGGELGHLAVEPDGKPCPCGSRGCLQTYAGLQAMVGCDRLPVGMTPEVAVTARADEGHVETLAALDTAGRMLGVALSNVLNVLDLGTVILGGSFAILYSWLADRVTAEVNQRVLTASWSPITVRPAVVGPDAAAIGGALTFIDRIRKNPAARLAAR